MSELAELRQQLQDKLAVLNERFARIDDHLKNRNRDVPDDWEDRAQFQSGEAVVEALDDHTRAEIEGLKTAIARIDAGKWAKCSTCRKPIQPKRMAILPATTLCARCAKKA